MNCFSLLLISLLGVGSTGNPKFVSFEKQEVVILQNSSITTVVLPFKIQDGYHIQSDQVGEENLMPTEISFEEDANRKVTSAIFKVESYDELALGSTQLKVISNEFRVQVELKTSDLDSGSSLKGKLYYQTCDNKKCYFPRVLDFEVPFDNQKVVVVKNVSNEHFSRN